MTDLATLIERNRETLTQRFADRVYRQSAPALLMTTSSPAIDASRSFRAGDVAEPQKPGHLFARSCY